MPVLLLEVRRAILWEGASEAVENTSFLHILVFLLFAMEFQRFGCFVLVQMPHEVTGFVSLTALPTDILFLCRLSGLTYLPDGLRDNRRAKLLHWLVFLAAKAAPEAFFFHSLLLTLC